MKVINSRKLTLNIIDIYAENKKDAAIIREKMCKAGYESVNTKIIGNYLEDEDNVHFVTTYARLESDQPTNTKDHKHVTRQMLEVEENEWIRYKGDITKLPEFLYTN